MADSSVPVWVPVFSSSLSFVGGLLSGQVAEYFRAKRDRNAQDSARRQAQTDKRIEFQRATLLEMQDKALSAAQRFIFIVQHVHLPIEQRISPERLGQIIEKQRQFFWRWSLLRSRVADGDIRARATTFEEALTVPYFRLTANEADASIETATIRIDQLNELIGLILRKLDSEEVTS